MTHVCELPEVCKRFGSLLALDRVAFSGEREERTLGWLTTLAPLLLRVRTAKFVFVLSSAGALAGWLTLLSAACS